MKLTKIYNKIFINELTKLKNIKPYLYTINGNINNGFTIKFKSNDNLIYTISIDVENSSEPFELNNKKIYTQGYKAIEVFFQTNNGNYTTMTNQFDSRVLITVAKAVKELVLKYDIQVIEFFGTPKPTLHHDMESDGSTSRTRVYKYIISLIKPDNYEIYSDKMYVTIYQDPEYYNKKRRIQK